MRYAFTMIELIFVIVILGVLAAVAIPKLAASRNDATASRVANDLGNCISASGGAYQMTGAFDVTSVACVAVTVTDACFVITPDDITGILNVQDTAGALAESVCLAAQVLVATNQLSSAAGEDHSF